MTQLNMSAPETVCTRRTLRTEVVLSFPSRILAPVDPLFLPQPLLPIPNSGRLSSVAPPRHTLG